MRRLEEMGIVDDVNAGMFYPLKSKRDSPSTMRLPGTTMLIEAKGGSGEINSRLELTRLTVAGKTLLRSLRVPSNVAYFEWIAKRLEKDGWSVRLIAVGTDSGGVLSRDSIPDWATDLPTK